MNRAPARFGWTALLVAWAVDALFWGHAQGISFPLWVAVLLAAGILLARSQKIRPARASLALIAASLVFALITCLRRESFTQFIAVLLSLGSLWLLASTYTNGNWVFYSIEGYAASALRLLGALLVRPPDLFTRKRPPTPPAAEAGGLESQALLTPAPTPPVTARHILVAQLIPVLRGLLLAFPVVLVLGALLASADPVFNNWARDLLKNFDLTRLPEYLFRLTYILIFAYALAGALLHTILPTAPEAPASAGPRWFPAFLGWVEAVVVLGAVNLLFLVFVAIQSWYLFGGQANISTTGFTYSEYAVRGFNELVAVAVLSLLLYLALARVTRQETTLQRTVLTGLNVALFIQVLVILASSFSRLKMYEDAYGFTQLRTYTHVLIIWIAVLLVVTIGLEITRRRARFALAGLLVAFGFGLTFGLLNVDGFIARQNIQRAWGGAKLDGSYLTVLSDDAVPVLLEELQRPEQPAAVKDILAAELSCRDDLLKKELAAPPSWLAYNLSQASASSLLQANRALWQGYPVVERGSVKLPDGSLHACRTSRWLD